MKDTIKTSRTAGYLEKIFRALNADWFGGELEEPIITIQSTPRAYGHVTVAKIWQRKGEQRHELNIGAETLERPIENGERAGYERHQPAGAGGILQRGHQARKGTVSDTGSQRADAARAGQAEAQEPDFRAGAPSGGMAAAQRV